jgi:hypothetical protein
VQKKREKKLRLTDL